MTWVNDVEGAIVDFYMRQQQRGRRRVMMSVAEEIRNHLAVRDVNYSVTELAKRMKTSRPNLSNVISGKRWLSVAMAFKLEKYCGLDAAVLLHRQLDQQIEMERNGRRRAKTV